MNHQITKSIFIGKIISYILPILAIIGVAGPLIFGMHNLSILGTYLAIPMFFAPIMYQKYAKISKSTQKTIQFQKKTFLSLLIFYFTCLSISIVLLYMFEVRPFAYYVIITLMGTSILFEILISNTSQKISKIILLQIMLLFLNIIWGVTLKYHYFVGRTDTLAHVYFIQSILDYGHITDVLDIYKPFPLWHILNASANEIIGITVFPQKVMFITNGLIYSVMVLSIYLVTLKISNNEKIALFSSLFLIFDPFTIFYGMYSIPRSAVSFLEIMLILLLLDSRCMKKSFLAIFTTLALILYHTASIPFILSVLVLVKIVQKILNSQSDKYFLTPNYILIVFSATLAYWMYNADMIFESLIKSFTASPPSGTLTKSIIYVPFNEVFNYIQYTPMIFFIILGALIALNSKKYNTFGRTFSLVGLLAIPVTFPGPALLLNKLASNFKFIRFGEYTILFITIACAIGFVISYDRAGKYMKLIIISLFIIMSFFAISNDFVASDNPLVKRPFYTFYMTEEETTAINHVANNTKGYLMSDYVTSRYLMFSSYESKYHILEIDVNNMTFLRNDNSDVLLIREHELGKRPLKLLSMNNNQFKLRPSWVAAFDYYSRDSFFENSTKNYNQIYSSGGVLGFV